jgi:hypothetical protein
MTQFTSFVAVEEMIVTDGGQPRRIDVPVEVPEGVNRQDGASTYTASFGTIGYIMNSPVNRSVSSLMTVSSGTVSARTKSETYSRTAKSRRASGGGAGGGVGSGTGGGSTANVGNAPSPSLGAFVVADPAESVRIVSPQEQQLAELRAKLHPALFAVVDRLKHKSISVAADESKFIRDGKAEIQIWLTDKTEETLKQLKELGFEVVLDPRSAKLLIGRLPIEKLEALAELTFVRYVAPQVSRD